MRKNSFDLLRLMAATMVLYSHQYALLGLVEPSFVGWATFGTAGVAIFFFLSGFLVWSSWERDPNAWRFFARRSLRIFPALWVVCLLSVFVLGPLVTVLSPGDYFASGATWRYLETAVLNLPRDLPGLFTENPRPLVVNGSLWTLPLEFLCYVSVVLVGAAAIRLTRFKGAALSVCLLGFVLMACYGPQLVGARFTPHLEMVALFWWGVFYGAIWKGPLDRVSLVIAGLALLCFGLLGVGSLGRLLVLACVAALVHVAGKNAAGARVTDALGDMSYGVYIVAFPVQQLGVQWGREHGWSMGTYLSVSLLATFALAFFSWHLVEKRALLFKPRTKSVG